MTKDELKAYNKKLLQSDIDKQNKIFLLSQKVNDLQKENAELKADNDARKFAMAMSGKVEKQLREENAELKEKLLTEKRLTTMQDETVVTMTNHLAVAATQQFCTTCWTKRSQETKSREFTSIQELNTKRF